MPCSSIAVVAIKLAVGTLNSLRGNAEAMQALHAALEQILGAKMRVSVVGAAPNVDCYFIVEDRYTRKYVVLGSSGLQLFGDFTPTQRAAIEAFINALPAAMAEQALVAALATQLTLLDDQPVFNEMGRQTGRTLVVRV